MTLTATTPSDQDARRRRTVVWVVALATFGLIFDGYDLVVYGAVVSTFLKDPSQLGEVTPAMAGTLGSYALLGMMFGALLAGAFGDILGRRKVMLIAYGWFSVGMFITALMSTTTTFGVMRFLTGLGIGALIATTATLVTEIAPPGKKNLCSAITYSGVPLGSLLGALLAILFLGAIGWRELFMIGALPIFTLLPLALLEDAQVGAMVGRPRTNRQSPRSLRANRCADARECPRVAESRKGGHRRPVQPPFHPLDSCGGIDGRPSPVSQLLPQHMAAGLDGTSRVQHQGLARLPPRVERRGNHRGAGWLPLRRPLRTETGSGGVLPDRRRVHRIAHSGPAFSGALTFVAVVGFGTTGTSILIYGLVANHFPTRMRGAAVAWAAGFGRLGGVSGPLLGGLFLAAGLGVNSVFYVLGGLALVGAVLTLLVPKADHTNDIQSTRVAAAAQLDAGTAALSPTA